VNYGCTHLLHYLFLCFCQSDRWGWKHNVFGLSVGLCMHACIQVETFYDGLLSTSNLIITHPFNGPLSGTTRLSQYQKGKTIEARHSECQWNQLGHMQVCTSLQTDNHASTPLLSFLQAGCLSCRPTNSVKALKAVLV